MSLNRSFRLLWSVVEYGFGLIDVSGYVFSGSDWFLLQDTEPSFE